MGLIAYWDYANKIFGDKIMGIIFCLIILLIVFIFIFKKHLIPFFRKKYIAKYISKISIYEIDNLSGRDFEKFLVYLFQNLGFEVTLTQSSHDYGADLLLKVGNITISLQSKLYHNHSVGVSSVQEVYSASKYYGCHIGAVLTNSYFSKNAINLAKSTKVLLWDRNMLISLISAKESEKSIIRNKLMYSALSTISTD